MCMHAYTHMAFKELNKESRLFLNSSTCIQIVSSYDHQVYSHTIMYLHMHEFLNSYADTQDGPGPTIIEHWLWQ